MALMLLQSEYQDCHGWCLSPGIHVVPDSVFQSWYQDRHFLSAVTPRCHSCWMKSRIKEVAPDLTVNQAGISSLIDLVKAIADSDVTIEEHE